MTCREIRPLLSALHDGELDVLTDAKVREHLVICSDCRSEAQALRSISESLARVPRATASSDLHRRVMDAIPGRAAISATVPMGRWPWGLVLAFGAGVAASLAFLGLLLGRSGPSQDTLTRELLDAHVSAVLSNHLIDVATSDRHALKPWFSGRVPISPTPWDLKADGYPLVGGRLAVLEGHPSPVFVYRLRKHWVDLFVLSSPGGSWSLDRQGFTLIAWPSGGLEYVAVSDADPSAVKGFTEAYRRQG